MKKHIRTIILVFFSAVLLSACQPTPQSSAVANKGNMNLEEGIEKTAEPSKTTATVKEKDQKKWIYEKDYDSGNRLTVDAVMYHTDIGKLPVLSVAPKMFESGDSIRKITQVFCPNAKIFDQGDHATTQQLEQSITDVKKEIFNVEHDLPPTTGVEKPIPEEDKAHYIEGLNKAIEYYEQQLPSAPDESLLKEANYQIVEKEDKSHQANMIVETGSTTAYIYFANWDMDAHFMFKSALLDSKNIGTHDKLVMPESLKDDAEFIKTRERIDQCVKDMGIDYMPLDTVSKGNNSYSFYYSRAYNGLQETYVSSYIGTTATAIDGGPTIELWKQEYVNIETQNNNVVMAEWHNPAKITKTDNGNVKAKTWEEIQDIFKKQIDFLMSPKPGSSYDNKQTTVFTEATEVHINRIELGLTKVLMKNSKDDYKLIPTWNFMGYETSASRPAENGVNRGAEVCYVTINAIDGTVIDRGLMY